MVKEWQRSAILVTNLKLPKFIRVLVHSASSSNVPCQWFWMPYTIQSHQRLVLKYGIYSKRGSKSQKSCLFSSTWIFDFKRRQFLLQTLFKFCHNWWSLPTAHLYKRVLFIRLCVSIPVATDNANFFSIDLLVEWLTRLTYNPKRVSERVRSRPDRIPKLVNKLWIQRGSVGWD
jgi:hypothetical protein